MNTDRIYHVNHDQFLALEGLAYRIADNSYMIERYGQDEAKQELADNHKTIMMLFDDLDKMNVSYYVQNAIIAFADDWRRYKSEYLKTWIRNRYKGTIIFD